MTLRIYTKGYELIQGAESLRIKFRRCRDQGNFRDLGSRKESTASSPVVVDAVGWQFAMTIFIPFPCWTNEILALPVSLSGRGSHETFPARRYDQKILIS